MVYELLIILALVALNGVLAGAEIAIVSMRKTRLNELSAQGRAAAKVVQALRDRPERFLATVQIGITVVGATAGAFGGASFAQDLEPVLARSPVLAPYSEELALAVVVSLVSYLSLVLGELVPKSLAMRAAEPYALFVARPLRALSTVARPLVWLLTASSNVVLRLFGDRTDFIESRLSSEELQQLVKEASTRGGSIHPAVGKIAARALEFEDLTAADVMVPRNRIAALSADEPIDELRATLAENLHSRLPVFEGTIDKILGYINVKDVLFLEWDRDLFVLRDLLRPPYFVPESKKAVDLLEDMRLRRRPLAIVVDEQGGTAGLVTLEDLLEELVGEIFSEHDVTVAPPVERLSDGTLVVSGVTAVRDLNREFGLALPEDGPWVTVGGLVLAMAGRIPAAGEKVELPGGVRLDVLDASPRRVRTVAVSVPPARG